MRNLLAFLGILLGGAALLGAAPKTEFVVANGGEPATFDPALVQAAPDQRIALALFEGLVVYDPRTLDAQPGLAEKWTVDKAGTTYTFRLRKTTWSDGVPITAQTVVDSWLRELDPKTAAPEAGVLADRIVGGREFASGSSGSDAVQMKALDAQTFQVAFTTPLPTLSLLAGFPFAVVPIHVIAESGSAWTKPGTLVSNGPYKLSSVTAQGPTVLVPNPKYWDPKAVRLTKLTFLPVSEGPSALSMFKNGEADWLPSIGLGQLDEAAARKEFQNDPFWGTYYYSFNVAAEGLKDPRVRRALALAVDRPWLAKRVLRMGQLPAYSLIPSTRGITPVVFASGDDAKAARKLLADAGYPGGKGFPKLTLLYNTSESHRKLAEAIADQWNQNLGIDVALKSEDWKSFLDDRGRHNFDIARAGWLGDYNDVLTFLEIWRSDSPDNASGYSNPKFDDLVAKAKTLVPGAERTKALKAAEALVVADLPFLPIYAFTTAQLIDTAKWDGWFANSLDIHPWKHLGPKK